MKFRPALLFLSICFLPTISSAQKMAITDTGEEVFLYDDGTWAYVNPDEAPDDSIAVNPVVFTKDDGSTFLLKSTKFGIGLYLNPKKWSFEKGSSNDDAEYSFKMKNEDLHAVMITEKAEIPLETFKLVALENAKSAAPDSRIIHQEYRTVNGLKVLHLKLKGTIQGLNFVYSGYYYSNENGSVQLITFTIDTLVDEYSTDIEEFINGLVEL